MGIVFTNHNTDLLPVEFDEITKNCNYTFSVNGETAIFTARTSIIGNIKGIKYNEELDESVMSIMPLRPKVSKILGDVTWDCICSKEIGFPMRLIGKRRVVRYFYIFFVEVFKTEAILLGAQGEIVKRIIL